MLNDADPLSSAQICSQLTNRLERQQAAHREELDSLKVRMALFLWSSAVILPTFISLFLPPSCFLTRTPCCWKLFYNPF